MQKQSRTSKAIGSAAGMLISVWVTCLVTWAATQTDGALSVLCWCTAGILVALFTVTLVCTVAANELERR